MTFPQTLRLIRRMTAVNMAVTLAYRLDFAFYMLSAIISPIISVLVWRAAIASGADLPVSASYLTTYFVLFAVVSMATGAWLAIFLADSIRTGKISIWLARPGSPLCEMVANNLAEKGFKAVVLAPMILIFGWFLRDSLALDVAPWRWLLFVLSTVLAAVIAFSLDVIVASLAFWIDDVGGVVRGLGIVSGVLAGRIVPLALMPEWSRGFVDVQPFRFTLSFPLEMIVGNLSGRDVAAGFGLQAIYAAAFVLAARWIWQRGQLVYSAVGA
jgi:ABC-2 type transport system permease protein